MQLFYHETGWNLDTLLSWFEGEICQAETAVLHRARWDQVSCAHWCQKATGFQSDHTPPGSHEGACDRYLCPQERICHIPIPKPYICTLFFLTQLLPKPTKSQLPLIAPSLCPPSLSPSKWLCHLTQGWGLPGSNAFSFPICPSPSPLCFFSLGVVFFFPHSFFHVFLRCRLVPVFSEKLGLIPVWEGGFLIHAFEWCPMGRLWQAYIMIAPLEMQSACKSASRLGSLLYSGSLGTLEGGQVFIREASWWIEQPQTPACSGQCHQDHEPSVAPLGKPLCINEMITVSVRRKHKKTGSAQLASAR